MNYQEYCEMVEDLFLKECLDAGYDEETAFEIVESTSLHMMEEYLLEHNYNLNL